MRSNKASGHKVTCERTFRSSDRVYHLLQRFAGEGDPAGTSEVREYSVVTLHHAYREH